jgi:hypothetical protein
VRRRRARRIAIPAGLKVAGLVAERERGYSHDVKPFSKTKANGQPRFSARPAKPVARSRISNNGLFLRGVNPRSSTARRFRDLARAYIADIENVTEPVLALARSAALAAMRLEKMQTQVISDEDVDDLKFVRLSGALSRSLQALNALKPKPPAGEHRPSGLQRHLEMMAERREQARLEAEALAAEGLSATEP